MLHLPHGGLHLLRCHGLLRKSSRQGICGLLRLGPHGSTASAGTATCRCSDTGAPLRAESSSAAQASVVVSVPQSVVRSRRTRSRTSAA